MQEKKLLRDALEALVVGDGKSEPGIVYDMFGKRCACCSWFNTISHQAEPKHNADCPIILGQQALATTTDETEMEKLVALLETAWEEEDGDSAVQCGIMKALRIITTQFGEEEGSQTEFRSNGERWGWMRREEDKMADDAAWRLEKILKEAEGEEEAGEQTKFDCWKCEHRGSVPGSAHICCRHPFTKEAFDKPELQMMGIFASVGRMPPFVLSPKELNIEGDAYGIRSGWFNFPFNFDPVWLKNCDGYSGEEEGDADRD